METAFFILLVVIYIAGCALELYLYRKLYLAYKSGALQKKIQEILQRFKKKQ